VNNIQLKELINMACMMEVQNAHDNNRKYSMIDTSRKYNYGKMKPGMNLVKAILIILHLFILLSNKREEELFYLIKYNKTKYGTYAKVMYFNNISYIY
jgi:hypothetical protein